MNLEYNNTTAKHYAAYRPELHQSILEKCINKEDYFEKGIDIGCGTGQSSIALTNYCQQVIGVDPSQFMIDNAVANSKITYQYFDGKTLNLTSNLFNIATFAGSLHYAKSQELLNNVVRIIKNKGIILVYDFDILLKDILIQLEYKTTNTETYNHQADFSGLQQSSISIIKNEIETTTIEIEAKNIAHLLLSVNAQYQFFKKQLQKENLHEKLTQKLKAISNKNHFKIYARLFYKAYVVSKQHQQT